MKKAFETVSASVCLLAVFALCLFMVAAGADVLSSNYANVPGWLGWVLLSEGFISFAVIIYHAIDSVCVEN